MPKFPLDVLHERVYPYIKSDAPDVVLGAVFGEDVALTRVGEGLLASHVDPIVGAVKNIGWLAVHIACNDIATCGIAPRWLQLLVLLPETEEGQAERLEEIMRDASCAAREIQAVIIGGHTETSSIITRPLVAVTALGMLYDREPVRTGGARVRDRILVTKGIAMEGTAILAHDFADVGRSLGLSEEELEEGRHLIEKISVVPEAVTLAEHGAIAMHDVTDTGLLGALQEMAHLSEGGIEIEYSRVPMLPPVPRFVETFRFDPLRMMSSGTLVAAVAPERADEAKRALEALDIPCSFIGHVVERAGVQVHREGETHHYEEIRSEFNELARMWSLYAEENKY